MPQPEQGIKGLGRTPYRRPIDMKRIEDVQRYVSGGYHPVNLGDTLTNGNDQYTTWHSSQTWSWWLFYRLACEVPMRTAH